MADRCDSCGREGRTLQFWDWSGKTEFRFCSPACRHQAADALAIVIVDAVTMSKRRGARG